LPIGIASRGDAGFRIGNSECQLRLLGALTLPPIYVSSGPGSTHRLLADGLRKKAAESGPCAFVYAGENHNHASESLEAAVFDEVPTGECEGVRARVRFGRMTNPFDALPPARCQLCA
jgi:hypothetical protein